MEIQIPTAIPTFRALPAPREINRPHDPEIGFLNGIVTNMQENNDIKRNSKTKGGVVKQIRNITQEVK
jgi:hypothetical protein